MTANATNINSSGLQIFTEAAGSFAASDASNKGDLLVHNGSNYTFLTVGANGTVLTLDSAEATGLKWANLSFTGDWVLLDTQTASSSSTIDFTDLDTSTYQSFHIRVINCRPENDGDNFQCLFSIDNGSSFISSGYSWVYRTFDTGSGSDDESHGTIQSFIQATENTGNAAGEGLAGWFLLLPSNDATQMKHAIEWQLYTQDNGNDLFGIWGGGINSTTSAMDALRFKFSTGTIDTGIFYLYGLEAS